MSDTIEEVAAKEQLAREYAAAHGGQEKPGFFDNIGSILKMSLILATVVVIGIPVSKILKG
jgi:hypothetical protein